MFFVFTELLSDRGKPVVNFWSPLVFFAKLLSRRRVMDETH